MYTTPHTKDIQKTKIPTNRDCILEKKAVILQRELICGRSGKSKYYGIY